jgi:hypothetical protein
MNGGYPVQIRICGPPCRKVARPEKLSRRGSG